MHYIIITIISVCVIASGINSVLTDTWAGALVGGVAILGGAFMLYIMAEDYVDAS